MNRVKHTQSMGNTVPFDLKAALAMPDWREQLVWPATHPDTSRVVMSAVQRYLELLNNITDPFLRRIAIVTAPAIMPRALAILEAAFWMQGADQAGWRMEGGPEEVAALRGDTSAAKLGLMPTPKTPYAPGHINQIPPPRLAWLRHLKISASWNGWQLPRALISPTATVLSVSSLLLRATQMPGERAYFRYPKTILETAMRGWRAAPIEDDVGVLEDQLVVALMSEPSLSDELRLELGALIRRIVATALEPAGQHLKALESARAIPTRIWSGTAGVYINRLIGLEVMRRGGAAVRFAHGGSWAPLYGNSQESAMNELAASSHFVVPSGNFAAAMESNGALEHIAGFNRPKILSLNGDPQIETGLPATPRTSPKRPRVMYVMTLMMGFRQFPTPSAPSDVVFLDWQYRLVEYLKTLPIELRCQPHPGGVMPGRSHPVAQLAASDDARFEEMMDWPDLFLFDIIASTTFLKAVASGQKVVLASLVPTPMVSSFAKILERRCTMIDVHYDDRNLPRFDKAQMADAVCDIGPVSDPSEIRDLYLGGTAKW
jgi:hypothetical protein